MVAVWETIHREAVHVTALLVEAYIFTCEGVRYAGGGLQASQQEASRWEGRVRQVE